MSHPEPWMAWGACLDRPDLPWIQEPRDVGLGLEASMAVVCTRCLVLSDCEHYVVRAEITSGFWAGEFRDPVPEHARRDDMGGAA